jgi:catechol 2,3-dioxygenase-like lactoylglutathione lyase family enzyme
MLTKMAHFTVLIADEDAALEWYRDILGFTVRDDQAFGPGMRWITVSPPQQSDVRLVLQKPNPMAHGEEHAAAMMQRIGQGTTTVIETDDCHGDYKLLAGRGVQFSDPPQEMPWGISAVFHDLYGNPYNLLQPFGDQ